VYVVLAWVGFRPAHILSREEFDDQNVEDD